MANQINKVSKEDCLEAIEYLFGYNGLIMPPPAQEDSLPQVPFSNSVTSKPLRVNSLAVIIPITPPPITIQSGIFFKGK